MIALFVVLSSVASGTIHRCGLDNPPPGWVPGTPLPGSIGGKSTVSARAMANAISSLVTDHYIIYWTMTGTHQIQGGTGGLARAIATGDSVPGLVRAAATGLEHAWHKYVDTLGYLPPTPNSYSVLWNEIPPRGKYPVELCSIGHTPYAADSTGEYFGLTFPLNRSASSMMLAADIPGFGQDGFAKDIDGTPDIWNYGTQWATVIQSTAAHEEFHSVQFNYDYGLNHFLFEASAVAMEEEVIPQDVDYIYFSAELCQLNTLTPMLSPLFSADSNLYLTYPHAWYVKQLVQDFGDPILRKLWEQRKANPGQGIETTLRTVISANTNVTFDTTFERYALRLGLSGRRYAWESPGFASFADADVFTTLFGSLVAGTAAGPVSLDAGQIQDWIDTSGTAGGDRIVNWIPDAGALLGHAWKAGPGSGWEWLWGSLRQAPSTTRQDVWGFSNPGPTAALRGVATSEGSKSFLWTSTAPARTPLTSGMSFSWSDGTGATLTGTSLADTVCTPLLHTDIWKPVATEDPSAYSIVGRSSGHAFVLEDADRVLKLRGASMTIPFGGIGTVWLGRGDGTWAQTTSSAVGTGTSFPLVAPNDTLDLTRPIRILVAGGNAPPALVQRPYPNPSRSGNDRIYFPLLGAASGATLEILSADGTVVRRLESSIGQTGLVWDVKNAAGRRVRPGVYWYAWRGVSGAVRGEILIAD
ncbi:MAG TPA: hypothetical protein VN931_00015 [Fibrobacteria bacterium]|nr:hypothetical protein [Fibrobacteria bacterium]